MLVAEPRIEDVGDEQQLVVEVWLARAWPACASAARVAAVARRKDRLDTLVTQIEATGGAAVAIEADIADRAKAEAAVQAVVDRFGRLDILISNAGLMLLGSVLDRSGAKCTKPQASEGLSRRGRKVQLISRTEPARTNRQSTQCAAAADGRAEAVIRAALASAPLRRSWPRLALVADRIVAGSWEASTF